MALGGKGWDDIGGLHRIDKKIKFQMFPSTLWIPIVDVHV